MWAVGSKTFANFTAWLACIKTIALMRLQNFRKEFVNITGKPVQNIEFSILDIYSKSLFIRSSRYILYLRKNTHCKEPIPKIETNIPRKGFGWPQSQFPHICVCERFIYSHHRSAYSAAGNMWTDPGNT